MQWTSQVFLEISVAGSFSGCSCYLHESITLCLKGFIGSAPEDQFDDVRHQAG